MNKITYTAINKSTNHRRLVNLSIAEAMIYGNTFQTEEEEFFIYESDKEKLNAVLN